MTKLRFFAILIDVNKKKRGITMAKHYFTINEFELLKEFNKEYDVEMKGLGPFGEDTGRIESFDLDDATFDTDFLREEGTENLTDEQKEELEENSYLYYSDVKEMFPDIDDSWDLGQVVVFNTDIGQCSQNFLQWDRCIGDICCDEDDYNTFMEEHEEFQTKEWHIAQVKQYMSEHDISLEDL